MALEVTYINGKRCYGFEKGNRFFTIADKEYEIVGTDSTGPFWDNTVHTIKHEGHTWEVGMDYIVNKILNDQYGSDQHTI